MNEPLILIGNAYWPSIGGVENSLRHLAQEAKKASRQVHIIVSDLGVDSASPSRHEEVVDGIVVKRYPLSPWIGPFKMFNIFVGHWKLLNMLRAEKRQHPNAKVLARFHFGAWLAVKAGFNNVTYLVPSVVTNQYAVESQALSWLASMRLRLFVAMHKWVQKQALLQCHNAIFSESMRHQCVALAGNAPSEYQLTKPGVDAERFFYVRQSERQTAKRTLGLPHDKRVVLFVGRFVVAKGIDVLIRAMQHLPLDFQLVLIGSGEKASDLQQQITHWQLKERVLIVPPTQRVEEYFRAADVFAMSSRYEPLGQTILEALAAGLPVAAFSRQAGVDTATEELGITQGIHFANEFSPQAIAKAILVASEQTTETHRAQMSEQAHALFSWRKLLQELVG